MGNFFNQSREGHEYDKTPIIFMRQKRSMEDVHEVVEYIRCYHPTTAVYDLETFQEVFESFFEKYTEQIFKQMNNDHNLEGGVDVYETIALMSLINNDEFERRLDYIFRLFDFNQSECLDLDEFILTLQTVIKGLCKLVNIVPPSKNQLEIFATGFFNSADQNGDGDVSMAEFVKFVRKNWELQDWFLKFADLQTYENAERRYHERVDIYLRQYPNYKNIQPTNNYKELEANMDIFKPQLKIASLHLSNDNLELFAKLLVETSHIVNEKMKPGQINYEGYRQVVRAMSAYDACDINEDNSIDTQEMEFLISALEGYKPDRNRIERELSTIDTDRSGEISRREWIEHICINPLNSAITAFRFGLREKFEAKDAQSTGNLKKDDIKLLFLDNLTEYLERCDQQGGEVMPNDYNQLDEIVKMLIRPIQDKEVDGVFVISFQSLKEKIEYAIQHNKTFKAFLEKFQ